MSYEDPLEFDSGLPEGVATLENARFGRDPNVRDGEVLLLMLDFKFADPTTETMTKFYGCGPGWETNDRGKTAERGDGSNKNFNRNTALATLVSHMIDGGAEEELRRRIKEDGLSPRDAAFYDGLTFDWHSKTFTMKRDGETIEWDWTLPKPDSYTAGGGGKGKGKTGAAKGKTKATVEAGDDAGDHDDAGDDTTNKAPAKAKGKGKAAAKTAPYKISDEIAAELRAIADEADTSDEFMERAYVEIDGATDDEDIAAAIEDLDSEWSIWSAAVEAAE